MICVFDVIDGPARGKRFWMRSHQRMAVGRISTADFAVTADAHMSRHHMILEANCDVVRLRDVGSANGTFVNETRIQSLELRGGDQIRAGSTIFELSILADDEDPHSKDGLTIVSTNQRTVQPTSGTVASIEISSSEISSSDNSSIENVQAQASDTSRRALGEEAASGVASPIGRRVIHYPQSAENSVQPESPSRSHDEEVTMRLERQWWMPHFQPTSVPNLLEASALPAETPTLLDVMRQLPASHPVGLIANCSQLSPVAMETLYSSVDNRLVTPLSQALLLLRCDGSPAVWRFVQQSMRLDAIICLAAEQDFQRSWLNDLLDQLSYPSMLASLLRADNPLLQRRLREHLSLALFERTRSGGLGLYLNPRQLPLANSDQVP